MNYTVIILAGGKGKRIKKFTKKEPKPLLKILGKPFIEYQINFLKKQDFKKIIISIGHYGDQIINYFNKNRIKKVNITFSQDGKELLGTGGAIKKIFKKYKGSFIILYGDSFLPIDFSKIIEAFEASNKDVLLTVYKNNNKYDKSNVKILNKKIYYNKNYKDKDMNYIDYGVSVINSAVIKKYHFGKIFDLSDLFNKLCIDDKMDYKIIKKRFYEIGSYKGINEFKSFIKKNAKKNIY